MLRCLSTMVLSFCCIFFCHHFDLILYFFRHTFWVFSHFFYCAFRHHFVGENYYLFSLFQNSHIVFLGSLSLPYYVGESEGRGRSRRGGGRSRRDTELMFWTMWRSNVIENVIHYYITRQRIQPPIISDFIVYLCRNYWINWGDGLREWEIADRFCQLIISWKGERSW